MSPDGGRIAITVRTLTEVGVWVYDLRRGTLMPVPTGGEADWQSWAPDGQRSAFSWLKDGRVGVAVQPADGSLPPRVVAPGDFQPSSWARDGRSLAGVSMGSDLFLGWADST